MQTYQQITNIHVGCIKRSNCRNQASKRLSLSLSKDLVGQTQIAQDLLLFNLYLINGTPKQFIDTKPNSLSQTLNLIVHRHQTKQFIDTCKQDTYHHAHNYQSSTITKLMTPQQPRRHHPQKVVSYGPWKVKKLHLFYLPRIVKRSPTNSITQPARLGPEI